MTEFTKKPMSFDEALLADFPRCGKMIARTSESCQYCGSEFTQEEIVELTKDLPSTHASCMVVFGFALLAGLLIYAVVSIISSNSGQRNYEVEKLMLEQVAKQRVQAELRDPDSAQFTGILAKPTTEEGKGIVCGYVRSRNGFGGMAGPQRFIVSDTIFLIDEQATAAELQRNWGILCNP